MKFQVTGMGALLLGLLAGSLVGCAGSKPAGGGAAAAPTGGTHASYALGLMEKKCVGCHAIPDLSYRNREDWSRALERMKPKVELSPADWDSLLALVP